MKLNVIQIFVPYTVIKGACLNNADMLTQTCSLFPKEKELESLAAMDAELQKIAAKLHDNSV